jgi:predicted nucleotidyltransferase
MKKKLDYQFIQYLRELDFVDEIWLFGSRARGDNCEKSDIDLAIVCDRASNDDWLKVIDIVENSDTLMEIDCVRFDRHKISEELYQNILMDGKVVYDKK